MEEEWSCYRSGHFNEGRMVMLQKSPVMEGKWSCYRGRWIEMQHTVITFCGIF